MNTVNADMAKAGTAAAKKMQAGYANVKSTVEAEYPEFSDIRDDLKALRGDVYELSRHVQSNGGKYISDAKEFANSQVERVQDAGRKGIETLEKRVKAKPGQALATAFFSGIVASFLLGRRR